MSNVSKVPEEKVKTVESNFIALSKIRQIFSKYGIYIAFIVICVIISSLTEQFFTVSNILNVVRQVSFNGIMAIGMTFVIITGGIDLSVGSVLALTGIVAASFSVEGKNPLPLLVAILIGLVVAALCGAINGLLITRGRVAPFIATMAMMTIARGTALVYCNGRPIINYTNEYKQVGAGYVLGIPIPIIIFLIVILLSYFLLNYVKFGRHVFAVGGNELAAKASGLSVNKIKMAVYIISALFTGLAGVTLSSRVNAASPIAGIGYELDAIAAAVIGGTSLSGGIGTIQGTVIGALIIGIISNGLDILNVSAYYQQIIKGLIIIIAVLMDRKDKQS